MEYISAEEFLKQDKEVQKVFIDWWKPSEGDLFRRKDLDSGYSIECLHYIINNKVIIAHSQTENKKEDIIPLFVEGQLRKFIEDKTECKVVPDLFGKDEYVIGLFYRSKNCFLDKADYSNLGTDLLQAYLKVALEIAKEKVKA